MIPLDIVKLRHDLSALKAALGTAKSLLPSALVGDRCGELVTLAEAKSRALLAEVDAAIDGDTHEREA